MKPTTRQFSMMGIIVLVCLLLFAACGSASASNNSSSKTNVASSTSTPTSTGVTPTQDPNHISLAQLVGSPTAKITSGTNFEVTGKVKNLDTKQHDIYLRATLTNASGQVVGTATGLADNVAGGEMDDYTLQGTLTQPTWANVSVVITKVSENVNGQGTD